jgi:hypothetical protein
MRTLTAFGLILLLAACSTTPATFGITGPGAQPAPQAAVASDSATDVPGVPLTSPTYGPNTRPVTGSSGFWGYN